LALSCSILLLTLGGIYAGTLLRRVLPEHHLSAALAEVGCGGTARGPTASAGLVSSGIYSALRQGDSGVLLRSLSAATLIEETD